VTDYQQFLERKQQLATIFLYDFQAALVDWSVHLGRAAIFADCGLGKTPMQLVWAQNIVEATNRPVLISRRWRCPHRPCARPRSSGFPCVRSQDGNLSGQRPDRRHELRTAASLHPVGFLAGWSATSRASSKTSTARRGRPSRSSCASCRIAALHRYGGAERLHRTRHVVRSARTSRLHGHARDVLQERRRHDLADVVRLEMAVQAARGTAFWRWLCSWARAVRANRPTSGFRMIGSCCRR
jgi:hypothetical protein